MLVLILDVYLVVVIYKSGEKQNYALTIRAYAFISTLMIYLIIVDGINVVNGDILPFLYKYPINKLTPAEIVQVEALICTLTLHKPVFRASDLFVVGTGLLASVSGTIVTYVLVALQFNAKFSQQNTC
ncbi:uncharacterized protein LOC116179424 [Photinus pyralis]|uniref:uncharacterized protein LOC116179424 n=1 Tax=Photinus pyralis TaxID=7054 RepID=UPI00126751F1|nr:uncharacterized protein LOC116179424 [Photinus pyralis]